MKYIFMGTPEIAATILNSLLKTMGRPLLVVTLPARPYGRGRQLTHSVVEMFAKEHSLEVFACENINSPEAVQKMKTTNPDLILVVAFGQILRAELLQVPRLFCLNVHASLLPKYRGAAPVQRAILDGEKETGITVQKMAQKLDTGDILIQKTTPIQPDENSAELLERLADLGGECVTEAFRQIEKNDCRFIPQDESRATYAKKLEKEEAPIDWNHTAPSIHNQIRGLNPWPITETILDGSKMKIYRSEVLSKDLNLRPSSIETDHKTYLHVQCGKGTAISLTEIQVENRKRLPAAEFLRAFRGKLPADHFESKL